MGNSIIREARKGDAEKICELSKQLGYENSVVEIRRRIIDLKNSSLDKVLVYEMNSLIFAWIHVFITRRIESGKFAEIGGLVVADELRGKGIGNLLVQKAEEWGTEMGVKKIRVRNRIERGKAHKFYARMDYNEIKQQKVFNKLL